MQVLCCSMTRELLCRLQDAWLLDFSRAPAHLNGYLCQVSAGTRRWSLSISVTDLPSADRGLAHQETFFVRACRCRDRSFAIHSHPALCLQRTGRTASKLMCRVTFSGLQLAIPSISQRGAENDKRLTCCSMASIGPSKL